MIDHIVVDSIDQENTKTMEDGWRQELGTDVRHVTISSDVCDGDELVLNLLRKVSHTCEHMFHMLSCIVTRRNLCNNLVIAKGNDRKLNIEVEKLDDTLK